MEMVMPVSKKGHYLMAGIRTRLLVTASTTSLNVSRDSREMLRRYSTRIDKLSSCWKTNFKAVHLCCGYPDKLDTDEYLKAPKTNYNLLAPKVDSLGFDEVSIENAEADNDLTLLSLFKKTKVTKINFP